MLASSPLISSSRPIWASIDLAAYHHNLRALSQFASNSPLLCVLKADAYGHGAVALARSLDDFEASASSASTCNVSWLGVASIDEGVALRQNGITRPILILSAILPVEAEAVVQWNLTPTVFTLELARALQVLADKRAAPFPIQVKIDTGMNRIGVPHQHAANFFQSLRAFANLKVVGVYTHFASADDDAEFTAQQRGCFEQVLEQIELPREVLRHACNSAGVFNCPLAHFDLVRVGIASYGLWPSESLRAARPIDLVPVMSLRARITHLKTIEAGQSVSYGATWRAPRVSSIATVCVGYADGYPRLVSGKAQVLLHGRRTNVVGRVTMDQIMVDVTEIPAAQLGDMVTLWGRDGTQSISADDVATWAQTIGYEITCGVTARVPRVVLNEV